MCVCACVRAEEDVCMCVSVSAKALICALHVMAWRSNH